MKVAVHKYLQTSSTRAHKENPQLMHAPEQTTSHRSKLNNPDFARTIITAHYLIHR